MPDVKQTAHLLCEWFQGRLDVCSIHKPGDDPKPQNIPGAGGIPPSWIEKRHLAGECCLGVYFLDSNNKAKLSAVDFDDHDDQRNEDWQQQAERTYYVLDNLGLRPVVDISQSGRGAHIWLFHAEPIDGWLIRAFWRFISDRVDVKFNEINPKQERHVGEKGIGNYVRIPLWNKSRFVDIESDWDVIEPAEAFQHVQRVTSQQLRLIAAECGVQLKPENVTVAVDPDAPTSELTERVQALVDKQGSLLNRRWSGDKTGLNDTSRSALTLSICTELVRCYIPTPEIAHALRVWCKTNGYEKGERDDWVNRTVAKAYNFIGQRDRESKASSAVTMDNACLEYLDKLTHDAIQVVPSGIDILDEEIEGIERGQMTVIAAPPGHGKSAFALQWLDIAAHDLRLPGLIISEEMSALDLGKRGIQRLTALERPEWKGHAKIIEQKIHDHYSEAAPTYIVANVGTIDRAERVIDAHVQAEGVQVVAVDYMQLLGSRGVGRYEVVTDVSRRLKQCAMRNNIVLIALSQMNREFEKTADRVPKLHHLRESGGIAQDADNVLFLIWEAKYDRTKPYDESKVYIAKNRGGAAQGTVVTIKFDAERMTFSRRWGHPDEQKDFYKRFEGEENQ